MRRGVGAPRGTFLVMWSGVPARVSSRSVVVGHRQSHVAGLFEVLSHAVGVGNVALADFVRRIGLDWLLLVERIEHAQLERQLLVGKGRRVAHAQIQAMRPWRETGAARR